MEEMTKELQVFDLNEVVLAEMKGKFMQLTVADVNDSRGFDQVHEARMVVKKTRVKVEKIGLDLRRKKKAEIDDYLKLVSGTEKYITGVLVPIENHLQSQEDIVTQEKARLKAIEDAKEAERLKTRVEALVALGCHFDGQNYVYGEFKLPVPMIKVWGDEEYEKLIGPIKALSDAEKERKIKEEAERKAESDRLAKVAADQEAERQRLAAEAKAIQDEKKAIEDARIAAEQAKIREAELQKARIEAAEKAALDTEERIKREAEAKEAKAKAEAEFRAKMEEKARIAQEKKDARRPDKQKLNDWLQNFSIPEMELKTEEGKTAWAEMVHLMKSCVDLMRQKVEGL